MPSNFARQCLRLSLLAPLALTVVACSETDSHLVVDQETGQASLNVPGDLPLFRAIDPNQVSVSTTIGGLTVPMTRGDGNQWSGTLAVNQGAQYAVSIRWVEQFNNTEILLGVANEYVTVVNNTPVDLVITQSNIDISVDRDGDDTYNLLERESGTDPTSSADPVVRPARENINVFFTVPDEVSAISQIDQDAIVPVVFVDALRRPLLDRIPVFRVAPIVVVDKPESPVFVDIVWFLDGTQTVKLARVAQRYTLATTERAITVSQEDYVTNFDEDADGVSNLDELVAGTDPLAR